MSQLKLNGTVVYMSGLWGGAMPVVGARVEIIQHHSFSSDTKTIWTGTTNDSGKFNGLSSEWRRTRTVGVGRLSRTEPDPTDVLLLTADITDNSGSTPIKATLPYAWLGDDVPTPPMVLRWQPPTAVKGRVNGVDCYSYPELFNAAARAFQTDVAQVTLEVKAFGPRARDLVDQVKTAVERTHARIIADAQALHTSMLETAFESVIVDTSSRMKDASQQAKFQAKLYAVAREMSRGKVENQRLISSVMMELSQKDRKRRDVDALLTIAAVVVLIVIAIVVTVFTLGTGTLTTAQIVAAIVLLIGALLATALLQMPPALAALLDAIGCRSDAEQVRLLQGPLGMLALCVTLMAVLIALVCSFAVMSVVRQGEDLLKIVFAR